MTVWTIQYSRLIDKRNGIESRTEAIAKLIQNISFTMAFLLTYILLEERKEIGYNIFI